MGDLFQEQTGPTSRPSEQAQPPDERPVEWLHRLFPSYTTHEFAAHHREFWEWLESIEPGVSPKPFVGVWARGGAKSTTAEMAVIRLAAKKKRRYGLYISGTQDQADDHVATIGAMLESATVSHDYPLLSERSVGKYSNSRGWRRTRLWTKDGFIVDAVGLDKSGRGVKLEEQRPDFMVFDDIDGELDTKEAVEKNIKRISKKLLPAGSTDVAIMAIQNLVIPHGVFASLARIDGAPESPILADRIVSGPIPAVYGLAYEQGEEGFVITAGRPSWAGQDLRICQEQMQRWGLTAFLEEAQHEVTEPAGGMFSHLSFKHAAEDDAGEIRHLREGVAIGRPIELVRGCVWVDPAVTNTDQSDAHGICAAGLGDNGLIYILRAFETRTTPLESLKRAITWAKALRFDRVGVETDQGGDTWQSVFIEACHALGITAANAPAFTFEKAGAGHGPKSHRASQMLGDYERGRIIHVVGAASVAERALRRFPLTKPLDYVDAQYWAWRDLRNMGAQLKQPESVEVLLW